MAYDVVIIGSGFGGSISANRLASAGLKVLVLERGPWRDSLPVRSMKIAKRAPFPYGWKALTHLLRTVQIRRWRLTLNTSGLFEVFSFRGLGVLTASAVGGGSHAWGAALDEPVNPQYWHGHHPGLNPASLEKYYPKILKDMGAVRLPQDYWHQNLIDAHMPAAAGNRNRCRPTGVQPPVAVRFPSSEAEKGKTIEEPSGLQRQNSSFDTDSFLGSPGGSKASVDFIYLAPVLDKGATVRDLCEVSRISRNATADGTEYEVRFTDLRGKANETVRTKRVIMAAGTMNTLRLLFASVGGAEGLSPMASLGRTFGANCDLFGAWFKTTDQPSMFDSPPLIGRFEVDGEETPYLVLGGLPGINSLPLPAMAKRKLAKTGVLLGMGVDSGSGTLTFDKGRLRVAYDQKREPAYEKIRSSFRALGTDSGSKTWAMPVPITMHQWGGACVGRDPDHGVVDHNGEVYGNPGLYVADGSALPAAVGGPPTLTIAAWAHHVAESLAERLTQPSTPTRSGTAQ